MSFTDMIIVVFVIWTQFLFLELVSPLEQGLKAVLLAKGSKRTAVNLFLMFVDRRGGQSEEEGAIPTLFLFSASILLWKECDHRIRLGWNVISQSDLYRLIASFVSHDSPGPTVTLWAGRALKCQGRL